MPYKDPQQRRERQRRYRDLPQVRASRRTRDRNRTRQATPRRLLMRMLARAKRRAKEKGVPATIGMADLPPFPVFCPVLGIPLGQGEDYPLDNRASLDRIRPELGYVPGNVRIISFRANMLRSNATAEELRLVLRDLEKPLARCSDL